IFDTHGILIDGINIEGENAVYNTGEVAIKNGTISATSYYALYNTGTAELTDVTASTIESDYAIYNTGTLHITDGTISTESAAGGAIYNFGSDGQLILAGSPNITGRITGFGAGRVSVATTYPNSFAPNNRTYLLAPSNLEDGDIVVTNGAGFIANFELVGDDFVLAANGNDLVAHGEATAVMSTERVIPSNEHPEETSYIFSRNDVTRNEFSAGPVPVDRQSGGVVNFFWQGGRIKNSTLTIYDAAGNSIRRLSITDASGRTGSLPPVRRQTGSWDLTDRRGRPVSEGTYLVKGTIRTVDGQRENVSVILGVR
ncbi:MAG: hypothetical protein LBU70_01730, partial [Chitinispirillales bacterium]|nr:hypothetical protein [Chitinispirillales bacterium]